jgi:hypothetical protein
LRRLASVVFLALGGWIFSAEPLLAFLNFAPGMRFASAMVTLVCLGMAAVPLAIGVALSPGSRGRELGLTILIALGAAVLCAASLAAVLLDPGFKQFEPLLPPMPNIGVAPVWGIANLIVVAALGSLLYRRPEKRVRG